MSTLPSSTRSVYLLVLAAGVLVGCGGHDSSKRSSTSTPASTNTNTTTNPSGFQLPAPRAEHQSVVLPSGDVLVVGGVDTSGQPLASTVIVGASAVRLGPNMSAARTGHTVSLLPSGEVLVAGGQSDAAGQQVLATTEVFDPTTETFSAGPQLAMARTGHAAQVIGRQVLIAGGTNAMGAPLSSGEMVDAAAGTVTPTTGGLTVAQTDVEAALLWNDTVLFAGGRGTSGPVPPTLWDPSTQTASAAPTVNPARTGAAVAAVGTHAVVLGGDSVAGGSVDGDVLDDTGLFRAGPALSSPRRDAEIAVLPGGVFAVVGGVDGGLASNAVEVGAAASIAWVTTLTPGPSLAEARWGHSVSVRGTETLVVIGGWTAAGQATATIEQIRIQPPAIGPRPHPPVPPGAITTFPYAEDFDAGLGGWTQATGDDFDWDRGSGATPSSGTGPSNDHTSGTGSYLFVESSSPNFPTKTTILDGPTFSRFQSLEMRFWYHMWGATTGSLSLDVSTDGGQTWTLDVWTLAGDQGDRWREAAVDLSSYANKNTTVRFRAITGSSFTSDIAIDDVSVDTTVVGPPPPPLGSPQNPITTFPYTENFDVDFGVFTHVQGDDFNWERTSGSTPSLNTGPSADRSGTGSYAFTESSVPNSPTKTAILFGPTFSQFQTLELRFWHHLFGADMGSLSVDVSTDGGQTWTLDVWTLAGDQGDQWQEAIVDLSSYAGQTLTVRFRGVTGVGYESDMAIDEVRVNGT